MHKICLLLFQNVKIYSGIWFASFFLTIPTVAHQRKISFASWIQAIIQAQRQWICRRWRIESLRQDLLMLEIISEVMCRAYATKTTLSYTFRFIIAIAKIFWLITKHFVYFVYHLYIRTSLIYKLPVSISTQYIFITQHTQYILLRNICNTYYYGWDGSDFFDPVRIRIQLYQRIGIRTPYIAGSNRYRCTFNFYG